jgi:hypothetical protein
MNKRMKRRDPSVYYLNVLVMGSKTKSCISKQGSAKIIDNNSGVCFSGPLNNQHSLVTGLQTPKLCRAWHSQICAAARLISLLIGTTPEP